jgi:molecular chaperone Hsp33
MNDSDTLRRFVFDAAPLRGHWVCLEQTWREARAHQHLPESARDLLGQALAAVTLLAGSMKFDGTLTLQLRGGGKVSMLVAQATSGLTLRGMVQLRQSDAEIASSADDFHALVGSGQMLISVERTGAPAWQGVVPLDGANLAACLEHYFESSEQLPTRFVLAADGERAVGLLLQKMPGASGAGEAEQVQRQQVWEESGALLLTIGEAELLATPAQILLQRVFAAHDLRLLEGQRLRFACQCSRERVARMLGTLGREELQQIRAGEGEATVVCEFCKQGYRFDAVDLAQLMATAFNASNSAAESTALN